MSERLVQAFQAETGQDYGQNLLDPDAGRGIAQAVRAHLRAPLGVPAIRVSTWSWRIASRGGESPKCGGMHIFIDESGSFVQGAGARGISLVGALVIPGGRLANVQRNYAAIRPRLPKERGEVKGRLLTDIQVQQVTNLLRRNEAMLELVAIDLNMHTANDIHTHKLEQAAGITRGLTEKHHPNLRAEAAALAQRVAALPNQLYVQGVAMTELVWWVCQHAINYYGQRRPEELASFHWTIDGKDKTMTNWEDVWQSIVLPLLQSKSIKEPHGIFEGCDLTHFARFEGNAPDWLPPPVKGSGETATDIKLLLMENFRYSPDIEVGLELVDIITSATRRALVGTLPVSGYAGIPTLMIHRREHYIHLIALHERPFVGCLPYHSILMRRFTRAGRSMLAPRFSKGD